MSRLIEGSQFYYLTPHRAATAQTVNISNLQINSHSKKYFYHRLNSESFRKKLIVPYSVTQKQFFVRKSKKFSLVLLQKYPTKNTLRFQVMIFLNDQKFLVRFKQKRILFAKQWMKQKQQHLISLSLNFKTGELQLFWPQIFFSRQIFPLQSKNTFQKTYRYLIDQFAYFFKTKVQLVFKKVFLFQGLNFIPGNENMPQQDHLRTIKPYFEDKIDKMLKYLSMSTIIDSFDKDKECFRRIHDKSVIQTKKIIKIQSNIDLSFSNLSNQLSLYSFYTAKQVLAYLSNFGFIIAQQQRLIQQCLSTQGNDQKYGNKFQYVLNSIGILKIQNKKRFISAGGSSNLFMTKMIFQYIFSDDPKYWIQQNRKASNNIIEKNFIIKQPKKGCQQKIRHQAEIIKRMKGAFSIYLPKYYKIQNVNNLKNIQKNERILILDYLRGQTLDVYIDERKQVLSFWTKIFLVKNIVNGLRFISSYKIVHLDLKPLNIIVVSELLTKIIDFSDSYHPKVCNQNYISGLTLPYSCPQILQKNTQIKYDQKCDVFSLGVIMFEIFLRNQFLDISHSKLHYLYQNQNYFKKIFLCTDTFDSQQAGPIFMLILQLIMRCLHPIPQRRPTLNWISIIIYHVLSYFRGK